MQQLNFSSWSARIAAFALVAVLSACASWFEKGPEDSADVHLQLGVRYIGMDKLEIGKGHLERALAKEPNNPKILNAMAFLYEKLEKPKEAKAYYVKAIKLAPEDVSIQNNYGHFLCEHKQYEKGLEMLTAAAKNRLNDREWLALTNAGICQLGLGQKQKAKSYFKQALLLDETYAPALLEMLKISYGSGEYWPAKAFLQRYLSVGNHNPDSLWFGMQTERALGNDNEARQYETILLEKFPLSEQAQKVAR
jgi:type IV pilus assembly protein PilF